MGGLEAVWAAVQVVFWVTLLGLVLRWPGRTLGVGVALVLWTVLGPWAFWAALGLVVAGAIAWQQIWRGERLLVAYPELQLAVLGTVVAVVAPLWVGVIGLAVALAVVIRWAWSLPVLTGRARPGELASGDSSGDPPLGGSPVLTVVAKCERCDGHLVATVQRPVAGHRLGVAQAVCSDCGLRLVGVVDATAPAGEQVTWFEPGSERWEQSA